MKQTVFITIVLMLALTACDNKKPAAEAFIPSPVPAPAAALPSAQPAMNEQAPATAAASAVPQVQTQTATVVSTIDVTEFTYIEIEQDGKTRWLAAPTIAAKKGDVVQFDSGPTMSNFTSKALNRTFPNMTFVNRATIGK